VELTQDQLVMIGFAEVAIVAALAAGVGVLVRRLREPHLAARWQWATERSGSAGGLVFVRSVYQHARRGSKAVVVWCDGRGAQDAWFAGRQEHPGHYLLLRGGVGWGPHNRNPRVLYVSPGDVLASLPGSAPRAWQRHQQRLKRARPRVPHDKL